MKYTAYWFWFLVSAVVIFLLGGLHMIVIHLDGIAGIFNPEGGSALSWGNVAARAHSLFFTACYIVLLAAALYHGLLGLFSMIGELNLPSQLSRLTAVIFWITGIALFGIGTCAAIATRFA